MTAKSARHLDRPVLPIPSEKEQMIGFVEYLLAENQP
jgi:hypothetical protein